MSAQFKFSREELREKTVVFFLAYADAIELYKQKIVEQLRSLAQHYLTEHKLPAEFISVASRTKSLKSTLKKLECRGWPQFNRLPEVIEDVIGTRMICWYLDDCYGIEKYMRESPLFKIHKTENYIEKPKCSGYRAIHLSSGLEETMDKIRAKPLLLPFNFEVQIRTKLQDAWGDLSHDFYYKSKTAGQVNKKYEAFLAERALRLYHEDRELNKFKLIWQAGNGDC